VLRGHDLRSFGEWNSVDFNILPKTAALAVALMSWSARPRALPSAIVKAATRFFASWSAI